MSDDPILDALRAVADTHPAGSRAVLAAALELIDADGLLDWRSLSADTRGRVTRLAADGWASAASRAPLLRAMEDADPAGEAIIVLRDDQLVAAQQRVEVALDNPFGDHAEDSTARSALARLTGDARRRAAARTL